MTDKLAYSATDWLGVFTLQFVRSNREQHTSRWCASKSLRDPDPEGGAQVSREGYTFSEYLQIQIENGGTHGIDTLRACTSRQYASLVSAIDAGLDKYSEPILDFLNARSGGTELTMALRDGTLLVMQLVDIPPSVPDLGSIGSFSFDGKLRVTLYTADNMGKNAIIYRHHNQTQITGVIAELCAEYMVMKFVRTEVALSLTNPNGDNVYVLGAVVTTLRTSVVFTTYLTDLVSDTKGRFEIQTHLAALYERVHNRLMDTNPMLLFVNLPIAWNAEKTRRLTGTSGLMKLQNNFSAMTGRWKAAQAFTCMMIYKTKVPTDTTLSAPKPAVAKRGRLLG